VLHAKSRRRRAVTAVGLLLGVAGIAALFAADNGPSQPSSFTGTDEGVLLGVKFVAEGARTVGRAGQVLAVGAAPEMRVILLGNILGGSDAQSRTAAVGVHVSVLLDYQDPLTMRGLRRRTAIVRSGTQQRWEWQLDSVQLAEGRHCLLIVASEDGAAVIEHQLPHHATAGLYEIDVGDAEPDHCQGAGRSPLSVEARVFDVYDGCSFPVLSPTPDEVAVRRSMAYGEDLWLIAPRCRSEVKIALVHDGLVQGRNDLVEPISAPVNDLSKGWVFALHGLSKGVWSCVVAQRAPVGAADLNTTAHCPPVQIS
jgi:hypothetical protein